jgi:hypothetical protein
LPLHVVYPVERDEGAGARRDTLAQPGDPDLGRGLGRRERQFRQGQELLSATILSAMPRAAALKRPAEVAAAAMSICPAPRGATICEPVTRLISVVRMPC